VVKVAVCCMGFKAGKSVRNETL